MRLSRLADYAIVLMTHLAQHPERSHAATDSAAATQLPVPTVARILARLCRGGLLTSLRGVNGGYRLARPAAEISVSTIVDLFDGPVRLTRCAQAGPRLCEVESLCPSRVGLQRLNLAVRQALDDVSLAELTQPLASPAYPPTSPPVRAARRERPSP